MDPRDRGGSRPSAGQAKRSRSFNGSGAGSGPAPARDGVVPATSHADRRAVVPLGESTGMSRRGWRIDGVAVAPMRSRKSEVGSRSIARTRAGRCRRTGHCARKTRSKPPSRCRLSSSDDLGSLPSARVKSGTDPRPEAASDDDRPGPVLRVHTVDGAHTRAPTMHFPAIHTFSAAGSESRRCVTAMGSRSMWTRSRW